ncbi:dephospho-CoA kinase [Thiobacter aerophilum]|uniref:Dephospho-CoA kinase n=1 Tax=Thiobacter aerophilum TaxID=3121275 RepID=A0ABV0EHS6_9BURK
MAFVIGLTGGIGSGKSTVAEYFRRLGATIIDTDEIAHALTRPGTPGHDTIVATFGPAVRDASGQLDRAALRRLVFADPAARAQLEAILHPLIRQEVERALAAAKGPYVVLVVPLLVEASGWRERVQRVLVVDCSEAEQVRRTMARSGLSREEVMAIMAAQASREARLAAADDVLVNEGDFAHLEESVRALDARYRALAASG